MNLEPFSLILQKASGLTLRPASHPAATALIEDRMRVLGLTQPEEYQQRLEQDPEEQQRLIQTAAVPETWFHRDPAAFETLVKLAKDKLKKDPTPLRILCLPCSTGEEAYSIAAALANAGITPDQYILDAVDINAAALAFAQNGEYKAPAFRKCPEDYREKHFTAAGEDTWKLTADWKSQVRFRQGNMLVLESVTSGEPYDFVFNRNLLIYFARPDQAKALSHLRKLLKPDGVIFVAAGEGGIFLANGFRTLRIPHAFAFRQAPPRQERPKPQPGVEGQAGEAKPEEAAKAEASGDAAGVSEGEAVPATEAPAKSAEGEGDAAAPAPAPKPKQEARPPRPKPEKPAPKQQQPPQAPKEPQAPRRSASVEDTVSVMEDIKDYAETGELAQAETSLRGLLAGGSADPDAHYLMGLIQDALGDTVKATATYKRVLQLDGNHVEAIKQLIALSEIQGDKAEIERLQESLARAQSAPPRPPQQPQRPQRQEGGERGQRSDRGERQPREERGDRGERQSRDGGERQSREGGERQPREGGDRQPRNEGGDRSSRNEGGERQPRPERGERPPREGGERQPREDRGERPPRGEGNERQPRTEAGDRPGRPERSERPSRSESGERPPREGGERQPREGDHQGRAEGGDRPARPEGDERSSRPERGNRPARSERGERQPRSDDSERPAPPEGEERPARSERGERPARSESSERQPRPEADERPPSADGGERQ
jgi:chemotaxis protein methyltransferase WspC